MEKGKKGEEVKLIIPALSKKMVRSVKVLKSRNNLVVYV